MRPCPFDVGGAAVVITVDRPEAVNVPDPLRLPTFAMFATLPVFEIVALVLLMEYAPPAAGIVPAESPGVVEVYTGVVWPKSCWGGVTISPANTPAMIVVVVRYLKAPVTRVIWQEVTPSGHVKSTDIGTIFRYREVTPAVRPFLVPRIQRKLASLQFQTIAPIYDAARDAPEAPRPVHPL